MSSIQSTAAWRQLNSAMHAATGRDFERLLLQVLRSIWPGLISPRGLTAYDSAGCDLIEQSVDERLTVAIQCKGFFATEGVGESQLEQILQSTRKFAESPLQCDVFVLVHNRDGRNREATAAINQALDALVSSGKAGSYRHWDRIQCLKAIEERLRAMLSERLSEQTAGFLAQMDALFEDGGEYVARLPVRSGRLLLRRGARPEVIYHQPASDEGINLADELGASRSHKWSLLVGLFGAGKTSCVLHAAKARPHEVVYVAAANLEPRRGEVGTNVLMSRIAEALHLFDDYDVDERTLFQKLAGPVLRGLLSDDNTPNILIIDALDENRSLHSAEDITRFASTLAELRCRVVLTTREEHFLATFGNYDHLFSELSYKGGGLNDIALHELRPWSMSQIRELVESALRHRPENRALSAFLGDLEAGETNGWPAELLAHPFFLRMIIELVAAGGSPTPSKADLLDRWSWLKLTRDLRSGRATCVPVTDRDDYISKMEALMIGVAGEMVESEDDSIRLTETISSSRVLEIASEVVGQACHDLAAAIAVTFLSPVTMKFRGDVPVRFTHRAFQEFYLAKALDAKGEDSSAYPETVRELAIGGSGT